MISDGKVSERVTLLMSHFKLNQAELARVAGVSKQLVGTWVRGEKEPGRSPTKRMRDRLGVNEDWLFEGKGQMLSSDSILNTADLEVNEMLVEALGKFAQLEPSEKEYVLNFIDSVIFGKKRR